MPLYTVITEDGSLTNAIKARIAEEITQIHSAVIKVPKTFVRVAFISYSKDPGTLLGTKLRSPPSTVFCPVRSGHSVEEKTDMLKQLWSMLQELTGVATDQLAISLQEIPSSNAMEFGQIMQAVSRE